MKKYIKYCLMIVFAATLFSCEDFLSTSSKSDLTDDKIFSDVANTQSQLMGIYDLLGENRSYRKHMDVYLGVNTDIEMKGDSYKEYVATSSSADRKTMAIYNMSPSDAKDGFNDADGKDPYSRVYTGIERANLCIAGIRKYGDTTNVQFKFLLGEALTLRAFFYNDLIKVWGDVPLRTDPITGSTIYLDPTNRDVIYEHIIADLDEAEGLVPWAGEIDQTKTVGRVSKAFVKGLKARICLMYAGFSLRTADVSGTLKDASVYPLVSSSSVSKDFGVSKVVRTVSDAKRTELYAKARQACKDIMDKNPMTLGSYDQIFKDQCQDIMTTGRESIFELNFRDNVRGEYLSYLGLVHEFVNSAASSGVDPYVQSASGVKGEVQVWPSFYYDFDSKDVRRNVTCCPYKWTDGRLQMVSTPRTIYLGKWRAEWMLRPVYSNDDGVNFCVLRYADVLLMFAETENDLNGPTADAQAALFAVRNRAFPTSTTKASSVDLPQSDKTYLNKSISLLTKDEFFQAIVQERAFEFCGENIRKWDLMRWGILTDKINEAEANVNPGLRYQQGRYAQYTPTYLWWRNTGGDSTKIEIYGVNPGETSNSSGLGTETILPFSSCQTGSPTDVQVLAAQKQGLWIKKSSWLTGTTGTPALDILVADFANCLYKRNPDQYQLFPITTVIIANSQGHMKNKYNY